MSGRLDIICKVCKVANLQKLDLTPTLSKRRGGRNKREGKQKLYTLIMTTFYFIEGIANGTF